MNKRARFGTGFTTIIMMLVVVVFTTLGVLALSTARNDNKLSDKNLNFVSQYYEAEGTANAVRAKVIKLKSEGVIPADIASQLNLTLHEGNIEYSVKVNESQVIRVVLNMEGDSVSVTDYALYNTSDWNPSQPISVWEG